MSPRFSLFEWSARAGALSLSLFYLTLAPSLPPSLSLRPPAPALTPCLAREAGQGKSTEGGAAPLAARGQKPRDDGSKLRVKLSNLSLSLSLCARRRAAVLLRSDSSSLFFFFLFLFREPAALRRAPSIRSLLRAGPRSVLALFPCTLSIAHERSPSPKAVLQPRLPNEEVSPQPSGLDAMKEPLKKKKEAYSFILLSPNTSVSPACFHVLLMSESVLGREQCVRACVFLWMRPIGGRQTAVSSSSRVSLGGTGADIPLCPLDPLGAHLQ